MKNNAQLTDFFMSKGMRIRTAKAKDKSLFYSHTKAEEKELGCVGYLRMDFGRKGNEFWSNWFSSNNDLKNKKFKTEFDSLMDALIDYGPFQNLSSMTKYCSVNGGRINDSRYFFGYIVESENYMYCIKLNPIQDDYNGYVYVYDKNKQKQTMNNNQKEQDTESMKLE